MERELARYIKDLKNTTRAEDRKLYESYLAQAACMLSGVVIGIGEKELFQLIDTNERLWGNTWLKMPLEREHPEIYANFKKIANYPGYGNN